MVKNTKNQELRKKKAYFKPFSITFLVVCILLYSIFSVSALKLLEENIGPRPTTSGASTGKIGQVLYSNKDHLMIMNLSIDQFPTPTNNATKCYIYDGVGSGTNEVSKGTINHSTGICILNGTYPVFDNGDVFSVAMDKEGASYVWWYNGTVHNGNKTGINVNWTSLGFLGATTNYTNVSEGFSNITTMVALEENSHTFNTSTRETKLETFTVNLSYENSHFTDISANLIYNGTSYIGTETVETSNISIFTRTINIPSIGTDGNVTFYWEVSLTDGAGATTLMNTTTQSHLVNQTLFIRCNATYQTVFVNFTIYNETTRSQINASMDSSFEYYTGDGGTVKNYTLDSEANQTFTFCTNYNDTFVVKSIINLKANGYNERTFYFNDESYTNTTTHTPLYMLNSTLGTSIVIQTRDSGLVPLEGYFVEVDRYYPEINDYRTVMSEETDEYGQFVGRFIEHTVKYRFTFKDSNNDVKKTTSDMTLFCRSAYCSLPFVIEDTTDDTERFENVTDYDWTFIFNNATNVFTYTWVDVSGITATNRLEVKRYLINGSSYVCNSTSSASSGTLTCNVGNSRASYQAQVFRRIGIGDERRIGFLSIKVGDPFATFGKEGMIWSFFLLMTLIAVGYWKPPVGIVLYLVGIVLLGPVIGIISMNPALLIAQFTIGVIFIWLFRG